MSGWEWVKEKKLELVNLIGSVSSIVGFAILILSFVSADNRLPPEIIVWQYVFFFMSVVSIAAAVVFTVFWVSEGFSLNRRLSTNIAIACVKILTGSLIVGVGFDALVSSIHWTWMLGIPFDLVRSYVHNS